MFYTLIRKIRGMVMHNREWKDVPQAGESGEREVGVGWNELLNKLAERAFDVSNRPEKPLALLSFNGHTIGTPGNLLVVQAGIKGGKSGVVGAISAAFMTGSLQSEADTLGFSAPDTCGKAVLHWDTEQSRYDHDAGIRLSLKRCKQETPPALFNSWSVADLSIEERRTAIDLMIEHAVEDVGGVACLLIDGVADLVFDPNDPKESLETVAWLHAMAIKNDCLIVVVIHENPGSEEGKTRGHLGSQLARKAESLVRLVKDAQEVTTVWVPHGRHGGVAKDRGLCFAWDQKEGMHMTVGMASEIKIKAVRSACVDAAVDVYAEDTSLAYSELVGRIMSRFDIKERAAKERVKKWAAEGVVGKEQGGGYLLIVGLSA